MNAQPVKELIDQEEATDRVSRGRPFPFTIPVRVVAYNCVTVTKYKMLESGEIVSKLKYRNSSTE
eukprot:1528814-Prymnesium_polylepis.1